MSLKPNVKTTLSGNAKGVKRSNRRLGLSKIEKVAIPVIILLAIWVVYSVMQPASPGPQQTATSRSSPTQSGGAPDFTLPVVGASGLTGQSVTLSSLRGKVVLLEFMEPWCPHCQNVAPTLESMHGHYGSSVVFISVAGPWPGPDGRPTSADDTAKFIQTYGSSWTYVYDSSGTIMSSYSVTGTPTFFVISKTGSVVTSLQGDPSGWSDSLAAAIAQASSS